VTVSVYSLLESLADARAERESLSADLDAQIRALEEERAAVCFGVDQRIEKLERNIRSSVLAEGSSIKGTRLQAVYVKGRTTWDSRLLQGYAVAHPEIEAFKKVGNPSVSIRARK